MIKYFVSGDYAPKIATDGSAGLDLYINSIDGDTLGTGVHVEIPGGHVGLLIPRSSWGSKGFRLTNTVGVIDSDYRGEILMMRDPHPTKGHLKLAPGDRVAQLVVVPCVTKTFECRQLNELSSTCRADGGFGSTDCCGDCCPNGPKCDPKGGCC